MASEDPKGLHLRADQFVFRLSPGDTADVDLRASEFGRPTSGAQIGLAVALQGKPDVRPVGTPVGLTAPPSAVTGADGRARVTVTAHDPGTEGRQFIDGQVYTLMYGLIGSQDDESYSNDSDVVSALVWNPYQAPAAPTWWSDIYPIFKQYADLYPFMRQIVDLGDYAAVVSFKDAIARVFRLPIDDPHYMPVTRDLSPAKPQMILAWLGSATPAEGVKPPLLVGEMGTDNGKHVFFERMLASRKR